MRNWKEIIIEVMKENGETWDDVIEANITKPVRSWYNEDKIAEMPEASFEREFDSGYGGTRGDYFCVWSKGYVYFPLCYDGAEWVGSAPRQPSPGYTQEHLGGG